MMDLFSAPELENFPAEFIKVNFKTNLHPELYQQRFKSPHSLD
jgi:hypothetical protein